MAPEGSVTPHTPRASSWDTSVSAGLAGDPARKGRASTVPVRFRLGEYRGQVRLLQGEWALGVSHWGTAGRAKRDGGYEASSRYENTETLVCLFWNRRYRFGL